MLQRRYSDFGMLVDKVALLIAAEKSAALMLYLRTNNSYYL